MSAYSDNKYKFKCTLCKRTFSTKQKLIQHINNKKIDCLTVNYSRKLKCQHCSMTFVNVYKFKKHLKEKHNDTSIDLFKKLQCRFCKKMFSSNSSLRRHCKNSCKVIKKHKLNLENNPIRNFLDFLPMDKKKLDELMKKDNKNIVFDCIDLFIKDSKNHNVYMGKQALIYNKNNWIKQDREKICKKIMDDIFLEIENKNIDFYNNLVDYYSSRGQDKTHPYLLNKLEDLTSEDKINIF